MKKLKNILKFNILFYLIIFLTIIIFITYNSLEYKSIYTNETIFNGIITNYKIDNNKLKIYFKDKEKLIANYYFKNDNDKRYFEENILYGSNVNIDGVLSDISNNTITNNFNYKNYLYHQNIYKVITINNIKIDNSNINIFYKLKNYINKRIMKNNNNDYLKAFILGDKTLIDDDIYRLDNECAKLEIFSALCYFRYAYISFCMCNIIYIKKNKNK